VSDPTDDALGGRHESLWLATERGQTYAPLAENVSVDVAVVGGGIVGIATAAKLAEAGRDVALLERDRLAAKVTGHTTAKLTSLHGLAYGHLESKFGEETARRYARANQAAIEDVAETADRLDVDCGFTRATAYTYVADERWRRRVHQEVDVATRVGLPASFVESPGLDEAECAVAVSEQAHFHPRRYLLALADTIPGEGSAVYEETTVTDVRDGDPCVVATDRGTVRADDVVVATHFPIDDHALFYSRLTPRRSYVVAARLNEEPPAGLYYRSPDPHFSIRPTAEADLVLFGGQNHRTGAGEERDRYRRLEREVRDRFDVAAVAYRWSTQDYVSVDGVPFVGPASPRADHVYVATGFGGWGMTNGVAAATVLRDLITDRASEWAEVFDPDRVKLRASASRLVSHNVHALKHLVSDRVERRPSMDASGLAPGEGEVFAVNGEKVAVARDGDGDLHAVSAICSHKGCHVTWNDGEGSWDCPCHGSRFDVDGSVLDTPANDPLDPVTLDVEDLSAPSRAGDSGDAADRPGPGRRG